MANDGYTQEWGQWRDKRTSGRVTAEEWIAWASRYVSKLPRGEWRSHCETHLRFVRKQAERNQL